MQSARYFVAILGLIASVATAKVTKEFPAHWGSPPVIQTRDYVQLPDDYGYGSSTLAKWIAANLDRDRQGKSPLSTAPLKPLYANDFEKSEAGKLPDDFLSLNGDFTVQSDGTNKFLELPGAPLDSFGVQFGPTEGADVAVTARIFGTSKGRRAPTFGVGLCGVSGYKLQVAPAKKVLELLKDETVKVTAPFEWKSGAWLHFRLQLRKVQGDAWKIEGKAWPQGDAEPKEWLAVFDESEDPVSGRASVTGSPFSGTPILFDDLVVFRPGSHR